MLCVEARQFSWEYFDHVVRAILEYYFNPAVLGSNDYSIHHLNETTLAAIEGNQLWQKTE